MGPLGDKKTHHAKYSNHSQCKRQSRKQYNQGHAEALSRNRVRDQSTYRTNLVNRDILVQPLDKYAQWRGESTHVGAMSAKDQRHRLERYLLKWHVVFGGEFRVKA